MLNKILLAVIAAGLWANVVATFVARPALADARDDFSSIESKVSAIESKISSIQSDVSSIKFHAAESDDNLRRIATGGCTNRKLC
jgi:peptidoglycan hydrolase CwlO-like protein